MARGGKVCIELNFTRGGEGRSRREKTKSFWEFIDARKDLVLFHPPQGGSESMMSSSNPSICRKSNNLQESPEKDSRLNNSEVCSQAEDLPPKRSIWYDELRILKELGLDRVALVASNACKRCLRDERNNLDKEPELADSVPQPYEELEADLRAFQERVKHQKPKFAYKDPGKYEHLMQ